MSKYTKRKCDVCCKGYLADNRNLKRGWGLCCSKSCSAKKRELNKRGLYFFEGKLYTKKNTKNCYLRKK